MRVLPYNASNDQGSGILRIVDQDNQVCVPCFSQQLEEAPSGFDDKSNGLVDDATHQTDLETFDEIETLTDGLGRS